MHPPLKELLCAFYETIENDSVIGCSHVCLYFALLRKAEFTPDVEVHFFRHEVLRIARISKRTFDKCMSDLQQSGYLRYIPSKYARAKSIVYFKRL